MLIKCGLFLLRLMDALASPLDKTFKPLCVHKTVFMLVVLGSGGAAILIMLLLLVIFFATFGGIATSILLGVLSPFYVAAWVAVNKARDICPQNGREYHLSSHAFEQTRVESGGDEYA